jgi:NCS1 family nucleobase:cation symporter-1
LYRRNGPYWYRGGFNPAALVATVLGIAPCVPGFLATVSPKIAPSIPAVWTEIYHYAWFISFGVAFVAYLGGMALSGGNAHSQRSAR